MTFKPNGAFVALSCTILMRIMVSYLKFLIALRHFVCYCSFCNPSTDIKITIAGDLLNEEVIAKTVNKNFTLSHLIDCHLIVSISTADQFT